VNPVLGAFLKSSGAGLLGFLGICAVAAAVAGMASVVLGRSVPCAGCGRGIPLGDSFLDFGQVFECQRCGARNVVRPRASPLGWLVLSWACAYAFVAAYLILEWRVRYTVLWLQAVMGGPGVDCDPPWGSWWRLLVLAGLVLHRLWKAFNSFKEDGPTQRL
jgi:DNA-directed RNA polymerase subunit RPC12/RpoP